MKTDLIVLRDRSDKYQQVNRLETVYPLLSLRTLSTDVDDDHSRLIKIEDLFHYASRSHACSEDIRIIRKVAGLRCTR